MTELYEHMYKFRDTTDAEDLKLIIKYIHDSTSTDNNLDDELISVHIDLIDGSIDFINDEKLAALCLLKIFIDYVNQNGRKDLDKFFDTDEWKRFDEDGPEDYLRHYKNYSKEYHSFIVEFIGSLNMGNRFIPSFAENMDDIIHSIEEDNSNEDDEDNKDDDFEKKKIKSIIK